ncbi:MAG TPA: o-succinylbenzoate synthase, partial [Thermoproteales archaeon]|nr:o-succinylbenzoate synthase [Thermoproteales archaeon]
MELRRLEVYRVKMKLKNPFETSFGKTVYRYALIIRLIGEGGEEGWGEVVADRTPSYSYETVNTAEHIIRDFIAPVLDKVEEPEDIIRETNWIRGHNMAKAGVEMALWDLKAKLESKPLSELIGGIRNKILSGVSIGIQENIEKLLKRVEFFISTGYKRIKIKIKPGWDIKPVKELRKEYPDILLQV